MKVSSRRAAFFEVYKVVLVIFPDFCKCSLPEDSQCLYDLGGEAVEIPCNAVKSTKGAISEIEPDPNGYSPKLY